MEFSVFGKLHQIETALQCLTDVVIPNYKGTSYELSSTASAKVSSFDQKIGLSDKITVGALVVSDKVQKVDQQFQVSEKTKSVFVGASRVTGAFGRVAKAVGEVGQKTEEKVENADKQQKQKVEGQYAQVLSEVPKVAATSAQRPSKLNSGIVVVGQISQITWTSLQSLIFFYKKAKLKFFSVTICNNFH